MCRKRGGGTPPTFDRCLRGGGGFAAFEEAAVGEGEAGVDEEAAAEAREAGDELAGPAEGLAGVEVARPRADLPGGAEVGVAFAFEDFAVERVERECGGGGARPRVGFADDDRDGLWS